MNPLYRLTMVDPMIAAPDGMDRFVIKGVCDKCGNLLGTLKASTPPAYVGTSTAMYVADRVLYHVGPIFQKVLIRCS